MALRLVTGLRFNERETLHDSDVNWLAVQSQKVGKIGLLILPVRRLASSPPRSARSGDGPRRHLSGARYHRYRCSLPGLAGFTADRRGETDASRHGTGPEAAFGVRPERGGGL